MSVFDTEFVLCKRNYCSSHWSLETGFRTLEEVDERSRQVRGLDKDGMPYMIVTTFFPTKTIYPNWVKSLQARYYLWQTVRID